MKNANLPSFTTISNFPASAAGRSSAVSLSHSDSFKAAEGGGGGGHARPLEAEETLELSLVRSLLYPKRLELGDWDSDFTLSDHGRLFAFVFSCSDFASIFEGYILVYITQMKCDSKLVCQCCRISVEYVVRCVVGCRSLAYAAY